MKASEVFDECHGRYRSLREWLDESTEKVRAVNLESPSTGYHWRPARSRACEFVADFERVEKQALRRPQWKGRLKLLVAEGTFDYWLQEVKLAGGPGIVALQLFSAVEIFSRVGC